MFDISIKATVDEASRRLTAFAYQQLPFAEARAATELAKLAATSEKAAMLEVFEHPTPFTVNSVAVQAARKEMPIARVYVRDQAARYLAPYEFGGVQYLGAKPADLVPVNASANRYGNLPRNTIRQYLNRPDVFLGSVRTSHGDVYGLWQRPVRQPAEASHTKGRGSRSTRAAKSANTSGKLKLLVAFHAPVQTKKRLEFGSRARAVVTANADRVFGAQLAKAIASAR
ncbi:conserved hypothetical protein [Burkholderia diffusa]|uniref:hypothetical protein n=1 Tax=Burkholderia diffusa TaxID=488732 RepID=UPI001CB0DC1C|nr:hypothetical protein [Burkholderia diffusa]CAG9264748.1 conserved hypothetical protein [Burkholderia diffusa]